MQRCVLSPWVFLRSSSGLFTGSSKEFMSELLSGGGGVLPSKSLGRAPAARASFGAEPRAFSEAANAGELEKSQTAGTSTKTEWKFGEAAALSARLQKVVCISFKGLEAWLVLGETRFKDKDSQMGRESSDSQQTSSTASNEARRLVIFSLFFSGPCRAPFSESRRLPVRSLLRKDKAGADKAVFGEASDRLSLPATPRGAASLRRRPRDPRS